MKNKELSKVESEITTRFFSALQSLMSERKVKSIQEFCEKYGLHRPKYTDLKNKLIDPEKKTQYTIIDMDAPVYLCRDYGVSLKWMYLGKGEMFNKREETIILNKIAEGLNDVKEGKVYTTKQVKQKLKLPSDSH